MVYCSKGRIDLMQYNYRRGTSEQFGGVAHLGERLLCKQDVASSILVTSTSFKRD